MPDKKLLQNNNLINLVVVFSSTLLCHLIEHIFPSLQQNQAIVRLMLALSNYNTQKQSIADFLENRCS